MQLSRRLPKHFVSAWANKDNINSPIVVLTEGMGKHEKFCHIPDNLFGMWLEKIWQKNTSIKRISSLV